MVAFIAHSKAVLAVKSFLLIIVSLIKSPRPMRKKNTHNDELGMKKRRKQRRERGGKERGKKKEGQCLSNPIRE